METAHQIFAAAEIHTGFAADRGVNLSEKGGGNLHEINAAHVNRSDKASDVADDTAAESNDDGIAIGAALHQLVGEVLDGGKGFVGLTVVHFKHFGGETGGGEGVHERLSPGFAHRRHGDDEETLAVGQHFTQDFAGAAQKAVLNPGFVGARLNIHRNASHRA